MKKALSSWCSRVNCVDLVDCRRKSWNDCGPRNRTLRRAFKSSDNWTRTTCLSRLWQSTWRSGLKWEENSKWGNCPAYSCFKGARIRREWKDWLVQKNSGLMWRDWHLTPFVRFRSRLKSCSFLCSIFAQNWFSKLRNIILLFQRDNLRSTKYFFDIGLSWKTPVLYIKPSTSCTINY